MPVGDATAIGATVAMQTSVHIGKTSTASVYGEMKSPRTREAGAASLLWPSQNGMAQRGG